ncbi:MAG: type IV secretion system protein [Desulfovibrionaceae bacterium]|nr:type IV secretion system protein [Desulfovibrionaceae bacterium]
MAFFKKKDTQQTDARLPKVDNPYLNGRAEWLERYGDYIAQARNWRLFAFFCVVVTIISICGNVVQASHYKVVPYVVEVDRLGRAQAVSRAENAAVSPQRLIQAEIATFVTNWRSVTPDRNLQSRMIERLSHFMAGAARGEIREWFALNNPYERAGKGQIVQVEVKGLPLSVSSDSWRIEWKESLRSHNGALLDQTSYEATVTIMLEPPTDEAKILANPGGIYITAISASKVFAPEATPSNQNRIQE